MKKSLFIILGIISCYSCTPECEPKENMSFLISETNKSYLNTNQRIITFIDQDAQTFQMKFNEGIISKEKIFQDEEECSYTTNEYGTQLFSLNNYKGKILLNNGSLLITVSDYVVHNSNEVYENGIYELDLLLKDITIEGFNFKNVLELNQTNNTEHAIWDIETILYSKDLGIEFILFRNGTWLKQQNN